MARIEIPFTRPTLRGHWREAMGAYMKYIVCEKYFVDNVLWVPRCALCGWREIEDDDLFYFFDKVARKPILVCRNHYDIYGFGPVDCITGMPITVSMWHGPPKTPRWKFNWYYHEARYWLHTARRFVRSLPEWALGQVDWVVHKYMRWTSPSRD